VFLEYPHKEIHEGGRYLLTYPVEVDDGNIAELRFKTPNTTKWGHWVAIIDGSGETDVELFETTVKTHVVPNALTPRNRNRNFPDASVMEVCHTPGAGADGTSLAVVNFGTDTGVGGNRVVGGGQSGGRDEIVLKQNTAYLLRITSGTDGNRINVLLDWYEHTNSV
jgi:hypothetical protein